MPGGPTKNRPLSTTGNFSAKSLRDLYRHLASLRWDTASGCRGCSAWYLGGIPAAFATRSNCESRQQSQRVTRSTPPSWKDFQPVPLQREQTGLRCAGGSTQHDSANFFQRACFFGAAVVSAAGGFTRMRSVDVDLTIAVLSRCSQSSMPRVISLLTYSMNSLTSPCIC